MAIGDEEERLSSSDDRDVSHGQDDEELELLGNWQQEKVEPETAASYTRRRIPVFALPLALCLAAVVLGIVLVVLLRMAFGLNPSTLSTVYFNDYVLDPDWDFDSPSQRREYNWVIQNHLHAPDGIVRPMILVNRQFPGPLVEANEGDTIVIHVDNQATNATAIHWHGIYQIGTPFMDGTVGVTQCPIAPGKQFTYEFTVSNQSGTYWWHAHYGVQASDGLHGPLIVHSRKEKEMRQSDYSSDRVVLISDHYHDLSSALLWQYLKPDMENAEPVPNSGLINGRSVSNCPEFPNKQCDEGPTHEPANIAIARGERHRLRLINVGAFAEFQVQIDEHELGITEVDGTDVVPSSFHRLHIAPAQRYSVIIKAETSGTDSFWLRARMLTKCFTDPPGNLQSEVRAVLHYTQGETSSVRLPTSIDWDEQLDLQCKDMNVSELFPVEKIPAPAKADAFFYLRANFEIGAYRLSRGFFNSSSWRPQIDSPMLLRSVDGLRSTNTSFEAIASDDVGYGSAFVNNAAFDNSRELVIQTTGVQTIDILISNFDDGNHPMHLHGYKYFVLAQGHGYPPLTHVGADINPQNLKPLYDSLDISNPLRRDTASVEGFGWILIRLVADNPGAWAFHCHLSWHSEAGLMMQFLTRADELAEVQFPEAHRALCAAEGLDKGAGPDDADYEELAK